MREPDPVSLPKRLFWSALPLILMLAVEFLGFRRDAYQVTGNTLRDYDTVTRMAYLRDVMARGGWDYGYFSRINAPYGMHLHWTLPFNLVLLCVYKLFCLVNPATALHYTGYWTGTIFRAVIAPTAYWAAREVLTPAASAFAAIMIVFAPYVLGYGHRGTANHHVLMVLDAVIMAGLAFRLANREHARPWLPLALGFVAAFSLWTTFEMVILIAPLFLGLFILWMAVGGDRLTHLLLATAAFAITSSFALLVDTPYGGLGTITYDHISAPLQSLAALPFIMALGALLWPRENEFRRFRYFAVSGAAVSAVWLACYPSAIHGVQGGIDPYVAREWLSQIEEIQPIHAWRKIVFFLGPGLISLGMIFTWRNKIHRDAALIGIGFLYVLAQLHFRWAGFLVIAAAFFLGFVYDRLIRRNGEFPPRFSPYAPYVATLLCTIFVAMQMGVQLYHYDVSDEHEKKNEDVDDGIACNLSDVKDLLNDKDFLGVGRTDPIVANEVNDAAYLVYWTNLRTLAGNYHRDSQGIKDDYQFFRDMGEDVARETVKTRGIDFVLLCGNGNNVSYSFVSAERAGKELSKPGEEFEPQETLYTRLTDQQPPDWLTLREWPEGTDTDLLLYQVDKAKLAEPPEQ